MNNDLISREALKEYIKEIVEREIPIDEKWALGLRYSLKLIDNAPKVNPYFPISEEVFNKITDAEWEHSDDFWITTPNGKKIEFEKKRQQGEWIIIDDVYCGCPFCKNKEVKFSKYCPECGARLKGGAE